MSLVDLYSRSVQGFTARVDQVRADQWSRPTPCQDWDVRALVNHVVGEDKWTAPMMIGQTIAEVGNALDGDLLGDDASMAAGDAAREATAAVTAPGALERTVHLSFGDTPAEEYIRQLLADHLVHEWDLAAAIGAERNLDPTVVHEVATWFAGQEAGYRAVGAIGARVELPDGASEQDRLIAAFGRNPAWAGPAT
jgi:uncharacterized protein (TIGR03086 family)